MAAIIDQFGLDATLFIEVALVFSLILILSKIYFQPFQELFNQRYQKTVEDREAAEKMVAAAEAKLKEYQERVSAARLLAKQDLDSELKKAHQKEAELFAHAREEAKRITQEAMVGIQRERQNLQQQLSKDVEVFANQITEKLVGAKK